MKNPKKYIPRASLDDRRKWLTHSDHRTKAQRAQGAVKYAKSLLSKKGIRAWVNPGLEDWDYSAMLFLQLERLEY